MDHSGRGRIRGTDVTEYLAVNSAHCGLMSANFTTLPHFSVSSAISSAKSAGEPASTVPPRSASRALILGSARPALIALELVDDRCGRALGCAGARPGARLIARHELTDGRDVRQRLRARRGRYRQCAQPTSVDMPNRCDSGGDRRDVADEIETKLVIERGVDGV